MPPASSSMFHEYNTTTSSSSEQQQQGVRGSGDIESHEDNTTQDTFDMSLSYSIHNHSNETNVDKGTAINVMNHDDGKKKKKVVDKFPTNGVEDGEDGHNSSTTTTTNTTTTAPGTAGWERHAPQSYHRKTLLSIVFVVLLGCAVSAAFLGITILHAIHDEQAQFDRRASELVNDIETTWSDYENAGLWIHEACRHRNISRKEFREVYEYIRSGGLEFQAAEFIPNVTHDERAAMEKEAREYYAINYPEVKYRGFVGFEPIEAGSTEKAVLPRSEQPFYFVVHQVEPVESNDAAIHLDLYSSAKRRVTIESALATWKPALTDRLRLVQETDESAYSVLLMHPGIPLPTSPDVKARDLSLMVIRVPSLLERATRHQQETLGVYLYDITKRTVAGEDKNDESIPAEFLGGVEVDDECTDGICFVDETDLEDLVQEATSVNIYRSQIQIASSTWEVVVVPLEGTYQTRPTVQIIGGSLIFVGSIALALWMYTNMIRTDKMEKIKAQAKAERAIVHALFPSNIRARIIHDAEMEQGHLEQQTTKSSYRWGDTSHREQGTDQHHQNHPKALSDGNSSTSGTPLTSEGIFGSKPIAEFYPEVTVMFADLVGFTAWSSARDPTQVFALLEVIYHSFDRISKKLNVFKLETVGDCYVAVSGLPDPRKDHAEVMARFAHACLIRFHELTSNLEITLGPDTADLDIRIGLHSGPVTAGVLRGDKGRFQLFGDTMNTGNRIESTGMRSKIHSSSETAALLRKAGKDHWITARKDPVYAKGKGKLQTFWVDTRPRQRRKSTGSRRSLLSSSNELLSKSSESLVGSGSEGESLCGSGHSKTPSLRSLKASVVDQNKKLQRLIDWNVDVFARLLKLIVARRHASGKECQKLHLAPHFHPPDDDDDDDEEGFHNGNHSATSKGGVGEEKTVLDEVKDIIHFPEFDPKAFKVQVNPKSIQLNPIIIRQLTDYITVIAELYQQQNPFHNFEHAGHVLMSVVKLLSRIVNPCELEITKTQGTTATSAAAAAPTTTATNNNSKDRRGGTTTAASASATKQRIEEDLHLHDHTYGITSDPLTQFACAFAALIHDVDHPGVPNMVLVKEGTRLAKLYKNKSVAEQNSVDIAWDLLMSGKYSALVHCICADQEELFQFRQLLANMVMATDVLDKDLGALRKGRWDKAFSEQRIQQQGTVDDSKFSHDDQRNRKATIVIEHLIQASDVSHTMQHWHVYRKWNERLFHEMYRSYRKGRISTDPSISWYEGEKSFFDFYIIPLAKKLDTCGVFGVSSDELLNYAEANRKEWEIKGRGIVETYLAKYNLPPEETIHPQNCRHHRQATLGSVADENKSLGNASTDTFAF